jgi:hypothetical protein
MIKKTRMRWTGNLALMRAKMNACGVLVGRSEGKRPLKRHKYIWRIILGWILENDDWVAWIGAIWLRIKTSGGLL